MISKYYTKARIATLTDWQACRLRPLWPVSGILRSPRWAQSV